MTHSTQTPSTLPPPPLPGYAARSWAGWLMLGSGSLVAMTSVASLAYGLAQRDALVAQLREQLTKQIREQDFPYELSSLVTVALALCALGAVEGALCTWLGWRVMHGSRGAIGSSIAITLLRGVIVALCVLLLAITPLLPGFKWDATLVTCATLLIVMGAYLVVQLVTLFLAWRGK
ncbi:MAG: hypothetical protein QM770_22805 [Tepidisphaeraceae bacterium]